MTCQAKSMYQPLASFYCPESGVGDDRDEQVVIMEDGNHGNSSLYNGVILCHPSVYGGEWLMTVGFEPARMMEACNIGGLVTRVRQKVHDSCNPTSKINTTLHLPILMHFLRL